MIKKFHARTYAGNILKLDYDSNHDGLQLTIEALPIAKDNPAMSFSEDIVPELIRFLTTLHLDRSQEFDFDEFTQ